MVVTLYGQPANKAQALEPSRPPVSVLAGRRGARLSAAR
jgi:hypothetical protein